MFQPVNTSIYDFFSQKLHLILLLSTETPYFQATSFLLPTAFRGNFFFLDVDEAILNKILDLRSQQNFEHRY